MLDSLAELTKSLLVPGTLTFLLFGFTLGVVLLWIPGRARRIATVWLTLLAACYWTASMPAVANLLATRFHASNSGRAAKDDLQGIRAIVVLGAGVRTSYTAAGTVVAIPDPQTVYNAVEGARIYRLF